MSVRYLHKALFPDSIAVLGAGDREPPLAGTVLGNIVSGGYKGRLCTAGVETDIPGLPAYPTAESVPGPIDLAIVAAAHGRLPETLHACGKIRAATAVIVSEGNYPSALGKEILGVAKSAGVRLIGPHAWGLVNPLAGLNAGFGAEAPPPGELAVISQSSAICASIIDISLERSIGLGFLVGPGDMVDVDFADIIDYAANSSRIKAILLHVERIANLRRFLSACRAASRIKPIIVLKTDRHRFARSFAEPRPQERLRSCS